MIGRREFIGPVGSATSCGRSAHARAAACTPAVGFLSDSSQEEARGETAAFHRGLAEMSYVSGRNVAPEYRWAEGWNELPPDLAADLVRRQSRHAKRKGHVQRRAES
jgi:putative ABC transport system substrate-binding protein